MTEEFKPIIISTEEAQDVVKDVTPEEWLSISKLYAADWLEAHNLLNAYHIPNTREDGTSLQLADRIRALFRMHNIEEPEDVKEE